MKFQFQNRENFKNLSLIFEIYFRKDCIISFSYVKIKIDKEKIEMTTEELKEILNEIKKRNAKHKHWK